MDSSLGFDLLATAAAVNSIDIDGSELIRNGSHVLWAMPSGLVGRVGERGTEAEAGREVAISRWLNEHGIRAVRAIEGVVQPTIIDGYTVTWWELLPKHRPASPAGLGAVLRRLHSISEPADLHVPRFSPVDDALGRLSGVDKVDSVDVAWVQRRLSDLGLEYASAIKGIPEGLIHGDAWQGNVAVPDDGDPILLDLEAFSIGPKYWDLISMAVDYTDFSRISDAEYNDFVAAYGLDVTKHAAYRTLADIQELRWTSYVIGKAEHDPAAATEARHRISCMQGQVSRPWLWKAF